MNKKILVSAFVSAAMFLPAVAMADTLNVNFEPSAYTVGNINTQQGWSKTGPYDVAVVANSTAPISFGTQSLRLSDSVTNSSFGDQTLSPSLNNEAGESDALNGGMSGGTRQPHFEASFDIASVLPTLQAGMHVSVSPDRGDGARMSYLRFEDRADGIHIFFDDVQGTIDVDSSVDCPVNPPTYILGRKCGNFVESDMPTITRTPHTIKFSMDFVNGPSNDIVKIYIDNTLVHTGTSWEDYYRFDPESNPTLISNSRTVDSLLFRESGSNDSANAGKGFLVDNISLLSSATPTTVDKSQCKNNGWKNFTNPVFKNQGQCVSYTNHI